MKPSSVLPSVLSFSTLATAATVGYTLTAQAPGTSIDGKSVHANGGGLWIGKPTASFCPAAQLPKGACPKGKDTVVLVNEDPEDSCPEHAACGTAAMVSFPFPLSTSWQGDMGRSG